MFKSASHLAEATRAQISQSLNSALADGLDLHSQLKVAHWNVKGPLFATLHPLFESLAAGVAEHNDAIAERAVILGGRAYGTARHTAGSSRIPEYPQETTRDLDHVRALAERFGAYLAGLRLARSVAEHGGDTDTVDLLTGIISDGEKHTWFLHATAE